ESFMRVVFRGDEPQGRERIADFVGGGHEIGDLRVLGGPSPLTRRPHPVHQGARVRPQDLLHRGQGSEGLGPDRAAAAGLPVSYRGDADGAAPAAQLMTDLAQRQSAAIYRRAQSAGELILT